LVVVIKKGNITITGRDSLAGKTVGVQNPSSSATDAATIPGAKLKMYRSFDLALQDLINGLIDSVITDKTTALAYANMQSNNLQIVGQEFSPEDYGIAVCSTNPDLLKKMSDGLAAVKADGTLSTLTDKWLKDPVIN
jgi:polar amino acid transport system substrate-binding protein